ncbi:MAG: O-antigen ligase family protein, partial [Ginsengibacter sp.]
LKILPGGKIFKKIVLITTVILITVLLDKTESRTAIIAFIAAIIFSLNTSISDTIKSNISKINSKLMAGLVLAALIAGGLYYLIRIRPASFEGRIFIWRTAIHHFSNNLFTGIGLGNFPYYYPKWQIEYFSSHYSPPISYFLNTDDTHVAFNEPLQMLIETGLFGFTCCIILLIYLFNKKSKENKTFVVTLKRTLILILIAGLSSYPLHCNATLFLVAFCVTGLLLNGKNSISPGIKKITGFGIMIFFLTQFILGLVAFKSMNHYLAISKWNSLREDLLMPSSQIKNGYLMLYTFLSTNGKFLLDMGEHLTDLGDTANALNILEESKKYYISSRTFASNADAYYQSGNIPAAIKNLEDLSNLIPNKFAPRYELVQLYYKSGEFVKGNQMARFILSMPMKKMSPEVILIKKETRKILFDARKY